jgi:uncharacterized protein (DUF433 family)
MTGSVNVIQAFSDDHVAQLTGLSRGQLRAWDKTGFFAPHYAYEDRHSPYSRVYSFRDVVGLRAIAVLMKDHHVSMQKLRDVAEQLAARGFDDWASVKLYVVNREVHFQDPGTEDVEGVHSGQLAMLPIIDVINDVEERLKKLKTRTAAQRGKVEQHKHVVRNAPVIAGTRIPTAAIRRFREAGYSVEQIRHQYPTLSRADIEAAISYEERLVRSA